MAEFNGVRMTKLVGTAQDLPEASYVSGKLRTFVETIQTIAASHVAGSTFVVARLPKGAIPLWIASWAEATFGGTATLAWGLRPVGGTLDADAIAAAATHTATAPTMIANAAGAGVCTPLAAESDVVVTLAAAALPDDKVWNIVTCYTVE